MNYPPEFPRFLGQETRDWLALVTKMSGSRTTDIDEENAPFLGCFDVRHRTNSMEISPPPPSRHGPMMTLLARILRSVSDTSVKSAATLPDRPRSSSSPRNGGGPQCSRSPSFGQQRYQRIPREAKHELSNDSVASDGSSNVNIVYCVKFLSLAETIACKTAKKS